MIRDFITIYRLYRKAHGRRYSLQTAWNIAVRGFSF